MARGDLIADLLDLAERHIDGCNDPVAARRFLDERANVGTPALAWSRPAMILRERGHLASAEAFLIQARALVPDQPMIHHDLARIAEDRREWPLAARLEERAGNWSEAARIWQVFVAAYPSVSWGHEAIARALLRAGRAAEAELAFRRGIELHPGETSLALGYVSALASADDASAAAASLKAMLDQGVPLAPAVLVKCAEVALDLQNPGLAATFFRRLRLVSVGHEALSRLERQLTAVRNGTLPGPAAIGNEPVLQAARAARDRHAHAEALELWADVRRRFPGAFEPYFWEAHALSNLARATEADALLEQAMNLFPGEVALFIEYCRAADRRGDWPEAARRWAMLRERFPERIEGFLEGAKALRALLRFDETAGVLATLEADFPPSLNNDLARCDLLFDQNRWEAADVAFGRFRDRYPDHEAGYLRGALVLQHQGRFDNAERLLLLGMERVPQSPWLALEYARLPDTALRDDIHDVDEATRRAQAMHERFPEFNTGNEWLLYWLRKAGRTDDAAVFVADARLRWPDNPHFAVEHARNAADLRDWPQAIDRFMEARAAFPAVSAAHLGLIAALAAASRFDEADDIAQSTVARFPQDAPSYVEHAKVALRRGDAPEAVRRLTRALEVLPGHHQIKHLLFEAQLRAAEDSNYAGEPVTPASSAKSASGLRDLILGFESLGGRHLGCEFGLVQRALEAEPLGLLRWTDMTPDNIASALEREFDGVGRPEHTELIVPPDGGKSEYMMSDRRFGMKMHTFVAFDDIAADELYPRLCRRLVYLREKLLADLRAGEKIFVFKQTERDMTDAEVARLHAAIRRYGETTLLYVRYADADHPDASVELAGPGLLVGYLDRFMVSRTGVRGAPVTLSWAALCQNARALLAGRAPPG